MDPSTSHDRTSDDRVSDDRPHGPPPDPRTDEDLVAELRTDPQALAVFYRRHVDKVVGFAARRCAAPEQAADVVAATFVAVIESSPRFDAARGRAVPWLLGIAFNTLMAQRRQQLGEARAWARLGGRRLCDPDDYDALLSRMDSERRAAPLVGAIAELPDGERAVLDLVVGEGLTPQEAAAALGITAASARVRLSRGRRRLRRVLEGRDADRADHGAPPSAVLITPVPAAAPLALRRTR